jgi:molybdate transport system substrate-binding protein
MRREFLEYPLTFSFGSSGLLATQVGQGAPFDVFAAADENLVHQVVSAGACDGRTSRFFAEGRIVIWTKQGTGPAPTSLQSLSSERFKRVAIANPEHAPYGRAAKQALEQAGIWATMQPRIVFGENVRQALQFAQSANADAAIVALGVVAADRENPWLLIDTSMHRPIRQALVVCGRGGARSRALSFVSFVGSARGQGILRRYGFTLPTSAPQHDP